MRPYDAAKCARVVAQVAQEHGMTTERMLGGGNSSRFVTARSDAICELRDTMSLSWPQIGKILGGMHHTSVMHHYRKSDRQPRAGMGDVARRHLGIIERQARQIAELGETVAFLSLEIASLRAKTGGLAG